MYVLVETLCNSYTTQTAAAQPARIPQVPPTAFTVEQPTHQPSAQSLHPIGMSNSQPAALDSAAAVFAQLVTVAAGSLGLMLKAPPPQDALGLGPRTATTYHGDLAYGGFRAVPSIDCLNTFIRDYVGNVAQKIASIPNRAPGAMTASCAGNRRER